VSKLLEMIDQKGAAPLIKKKGIKISVEEKIKSKADYYHELIGDLKVISKRDLKPEESKQFDSIVDKIDEVVKQSQLFHGSNQL